MKKYNTEKIALTQNYELWISVGKKPGLFLWIKYEIVFWGIWVLLVKNFKNNNHENTKKYILFRKILSFNDLKLYKWNIFKTAIVFEIMSGFMIK